MAAGLDHAVLKDFRNHVSFVLGKSLGRCSHQGGQDARRQGKDRKMTGQGFHFPA